MAEQVSVPRKEWLELKRLLRQASQHQVEWLTDQPARELRPLSLRYADQALTRLYPSGLS